MLKGCFCYKYALKIHVASKHYLPNTTWAAIRQHKNNNNSNNHLRHKQTNKYIKKHLFNCRQISQKKSFKKCWFLWRAGLPLISALISQNQDSCLKSMNDIQSNQNANQTSSSQFFNCCCSFKLLLSWKKRNNSF